MMSAKFLQAFNKHKKQRDLCLETIRDAYSNNEITLDDAIQSLLLATSSFFNASLSSDDLQSFKFNFICDFFDAQEFDFRSHPEQAAEIIQGFIDEYKERLENELDQQLKNIINIIDNMSSTEFFQIIEKVDQVRSKYNSQETGRTTEGYGGIMIAPTYLIIKGIKNATRNGQHLSTNNNVGNDRLDIFSAIYQYLTATGDETANSYKFMLILHLTGFNSTFKTVSYKKIINHEAPATELGGFLKRSLHSLYKSDRPKWITRALITKMSEIKKERSVLLSEVVDDYVLNFQVTKADLIAAIKNLQKEKADESSASYNLFTKLKNHNRDGTLNEILNKLETSQLTALQALYEILTEKSGTTGPHSLKYQLLITLFPKLKSENQIISKDKSEETINYFISNIMEKINNRNIQKADKKDNHFNSSSNLDSLEPPIPLDFVPTTSSRTKKMIVIKVGLAQRFPTFSLTVATKKLALLFDLDERLYLQLAVSL